MTDSEKCICCGIREADDHLSDASAAREPGYADFVGGAISNKCFVEAGTSAAFAAKIRRRRDSRTESPSYYITRPEVLPEALPAGHVVNLKLYRREAMVTVRLVATQSASLRVAIDCYSGHWVDELGIYYNMSAEWVDWSTVPIQEAPAPLLVAGPVTSKTLNGLEVLWFDPAAKEINLRAKCLDCSAGAVTEGRRVYCAHRAAVDGYSRSAFDSRDENEAAAGRIAAFERKQLPRSTASSRELAKGHPSGWPSQDGEP